jgi:Uma2 family endonuclease
MIARIRDPRLTEQLIAQRRACGGDRYDEVWEGEYVMSPLANNEHQILATRLAAIFFALLGESDDVLSMAGANVSDREHDWTHNFRCPDVVVVLPGSRAQNRDTHWFGGPDFLVEIASEGDASHEKFDFYSSVGVRELLIVDRDPWALELYQLNEAGVLVLVGKTSVDSTHEVHSEVLDADFALAAKGSGMSIKVFHHPTGRSWQT